MSWSLLKMGDLPSCLAQSMSQPNPPFSVPTFNATVPEDSPEFHVVLTLLASDPDMAENGHLTSTFSSVTPSKIKTHFAINATTSELKLSTTRRTNCSDFYDLPGVGCNPGQGRQRQRPSDRRHTSGHIRAREHQHRHLHRTNLVVGLLTAAKHRNRLPAQPSVFTVELTTPLDCERSRTQCHLQVYKLSI